MTDSILDSVKLGVNGAASDYTAFDNQFLMHINSVFCVLNDFGVGPEDGFEIEDSSTKWSDYLEDRKLLNLVKNYMIDKVHLAFDPPSNSVIKQAIVDDANEMEWRIIHAVDIKGAME